MPESNKLALVSDATAALQTTSSLPSNKCITYQEMLDMIESAGGNPGSGDLGSIFLDSYNESGLQVNKTVRCFNMHNVSAVKFSTGDVVNPGETKDISYSGLVIGGGGGSTSCTVTFNGTTSGYDMQAISFNYYSYSPRFIMIDMANIKSQYTTCECSSRFQKSNVIIFAPN